MKPARLPRHLIPLLLTAILLVALAGISQPLPAAGAGAHSPALQGIQPNSQAHITDGVAALGIVLVAIIVAGVLWGSRGRRREFPKKKK